MAAVLKTVVRQRTGGSNPSSSAQGKVNQWRRRNAAFLRGRRTAESLLSGSSVAAQKETETRHCLLCSRRLRDSATEGSGIPYFPFPFLSLPSSSAVRAGALRDPRAGKHVIFCPDIGKTALRAGKCPIFCPAIGIGAFCLQGDLWFWQTLAIVVVALVALVLPGAGGLSARPLVLFF